MAWQLLAELDSERRREPWSVCSRMKEIEERYLKIGPPSCITRLPRSLIANFGHLKASELRTFLLFYSIPCLYGILPEQYFQHYILLVEAIYLLLQDSISPNDIIKASALLKHFCIRIKELYAVRYETFNVHCLLHLTERVTDLGPLWTHSCFCFEDFNGELRSLFHGTQSIEEQIVLAISVQQKIPELVPLLENGSSCQEFYERLSRKRHLVYKKEKLSDDSKYSIGGIYKIISLLPQNEQWLNPWWDQLTKFISFRGYLLGSSWSIPSHTRAWPEGTTLLLNSNLAVEIGHLVMDTSCFIPRLICNVQILHSMMTNANVKNQFIMPWSMFWNLTRTSLLLMMFTLVLLFRIWFQSSGVTIVSLSFQWRTLFNYAFTLTVDMIAHPL